MKCVASLLLAVVLAGCGTVSTNLDKDFVMGMDRPAKILLPDLEALYKGTPPTLDAEQKARRLKLLEEWKSNIDKGVKRVEQK